MAFSFSKGFDPRCSLLWNSYYCFSFASFHSPCNSINIVTFYKTYYLLEIEYFEIWIKNIEYGRRAANYAMVWFCLLFKLSEGGGRLLTSAKVRLYQKCRELWVVHMLLKWERGYMRSKEILITWLIGYLLSFLNENMCKYIILDKYPRKRG